MGAETSADEFASVDLISKKPLSGSSDLYRRATPTTSDESELESENDTGSLYSPSEKSALWDESENAFSSAATTPEATPKKNMRNTISWKRGPLNKSRVQKSTCLGQSDAEDDASPFTVVDLAHRKANHFVTPLIKKTVGHMESGFNHYEKPTGKVYVFSHKSYPKLFKVGFTDRAAATRLKESLCNKLGAEIIYETEEEFLGARKVEALVQATFHHKMFQIVGCGYCAKDHKEWFEVEEKDMVNCVEAWTAYVRSPVYDSRGCRTAQYDEFSAALFDLSPQRVLRVLEELFPLDATAKQTRCLPTAQVHAGDENATQGSRVRRPLHGDSSARSDTTKETDTKKSSTKKTGKTAAVKKKTDRSSDVDDSTRFTLQRRASTFDKFHLGVQAGLAKLNIRSRKTDE